MKTTEKIKEIALDLLFPPKCVFCGKLLDKGESGICKDCLGTLPETEGEDAKTKGDFFRFCVSPLYYRGLVRDSVLRFKFNGRQGYAETYAELIKPCVDRNIDRKIDMVSWVPVSRKRLRKRGYDQAKLIAEALSELLDVPCVQTTEKVRDNKAQSGIDGAEKRRANVMGVYKAISGSASGKTVLLVDDIITTGATISECARTLLMAGAESVYCATLAKAGKDDI